MDPGGKGQEGGWGAAIDDARGGSDEGGIIAEASAGE